MSNPYEPYQPPGGNDPYGSNPYGGPSVPGGPGGPGGPYNPYGQGYGGNPQPAPNDAVSITGFVLSLTCCLSIVGAILGFIGLKRTKNGQRRARWAAIAASIIGPIGTLAAIGLTILVVWGIDQVVTPDNAEVGQCVDVDDDDRDQIGLTKAKCGESHDAEIVAVAEAGDYEGVLDDSVLTTDVCAQVMDQADIDAVNQWQDETGRTLQFSVVIEDPDNIDPDDKFACYVEPTSGSLDEAVL